MKKLIWSLLLIITFHAFGFAQARGLEITHLTGNFYVYVTYGDADGKPYPANSMYLVTDSGVVMFDTPWDTTQFQPLLDSIQLRHHENVVLCIATHFHADRTAGLEFLRNKGIATYTSKLTYDLCKARGEKQAQFFFVRDTTFRIGNYVLQTAYRGAGHTSDNIVIWCNKDKILYGGCLVKSVVNSSIGNVSDANISEWPKTIRKIMAEFSEAKYVIPGHLDWTGGNHLKQTLRLISEYGKSK